MKKYIIILITLFMFSGCYKDFLEKDPIGMSDILTSLKDDKSAQLVLNGVYDMMQGQNAYDRNFYLYGDIMSDDTEEGGNPGCSDVMGYRDYHRYNISASNNQLQNFYTEMYTGIQRANNIILNAEPSNDELKRIIAEAKVLRSLFHFDLVRVFGPVIYVDKSINFAEASSLTNRQVDGDDDAGTKQVAMIYDKLVETLEEAIPDLKQSNPGYLYKASGKGLLVKVLMYRNKEGDYKKALDLVNEMYSEIGDPNVKYPEVFSLHNKNNQEGLIEIQYLKSSEYAKNNGGEGSIRMIDQSARYVYDIKNGELKAPSGYLYYGLNAPTHNLVSIFDVDAENQEYDPRLDMITKDENSLYPGSVRDSILKKEGTKAVFYPIYFESSNTGYSAHRKAEIRLISDINNSQAVGLNNILLRYSDVLLLGAEAAFELGDKNTALKYINLIRKRARESKILQRSLGGETDNPEFTYTTSVLPKDLTLSELTMDEIRLERRKELFAEGQRFFDLVRWGIQDEVLGALKFDGCGVAINWKSHNKVLPLPQNEINQHGGKLVQNPGYN